MYCVQWYLMCHDYLKKVDSDHAHKTLALKVKQVCLTNEHRPAD